MRLCVVCLIATALVGLCFRRTINPAAKRKHFSVHSLPQMAFKQTRALESALMKKKKICSVHKHQVNEVN